MLWIQDGLFFVLLVVYGTIQTGRSKKLLRRIVRLPRRTRLIAGPALILAGLGFLSSGLGAAEWLGGSSGNALTPVEWSILGVAGLAFVHCQTLGMAVLVSLTHRPVTLEPAQTSTITKREGNSVDEKSPD